MNGYERGSRKEQDKDRDRCKHYERWRGYESTTRKGGPSTSVRVYKVNGDKDEVLLVIKAKLLCQLQRGTSDREKRIRAGEERDSESLGDKATKILLHHVLGSCMKALNDHMTKSLSRLASDHYLLHMFLFASGRPCTDIG
jgi:hypothetical protein